jgi:uncharacterized membrane protein YqaE (UPF0057 family)
MSRMLMRRGSLVQRSEVGGSKVMDVLRVLLAVLCPPLGVFLRVGFGGHFWLSCLLTFFGYIPGLVHAIWLLAQASETRFRVSYV